MSEPVLTEIDHVAIAVRDLDGAVEYYCATYGVEPVHREVVENDGVGTPCCASPTRTSASSPVSGDSPVAEVPRQEGRGGSTSRTGSTTAPPPLVR
jgi:catechol 2,3-dioxygenase-like lactoylglutathione lyase family enzyme